MRFLYLLILLTACGPAKPDLGDEPAGDDADGDGSLAGADCDDDDPDRHPGATEVCDGVDDDCDGEADEGVLETFWADADGDGYGAGANTVLGCSAPAGMVANDTDCDDADAAINPDATEVCNGVDDDCDGAADDDYGAWYTDADGDGYGDPATGVETCTPEDGRVLDGTDCDDVNAEVNPGATETCDYDDDNCDGRADQGVVQEWHPDSDGDGYGHIYTVLETCDPPDGYVLDNSDCRPGDAEAYPGAPERCNDDDDDCDGETDEDFELDGDGELSDACGGTDCDDTNADVNTNGVEVCDDGLDNDCDGDDARCGFDGDMDLGAADVKVYSDQPNFDAGRLVEVGDFDGDGNDDLLVAAMYADGYKGGAYVVYGPLFGTSALDTAGYRIEGNPSTNSLGRSIGVGDVDGDGIDDIAVGSPDGTDKEWIFFGPITADVDVADADIEYAGTVNTEVGHGSDIADVNGDGVDDAVIGAYEDAEGGYTAGAVFIDYGPLTAGSYDFRDGDYDAKLIGDVAGAYAGRYVRAGADVDGDGMGDVLAAAPYSSVSGSYSGAAYVVYGGVTGDYDLASADGVMLGEDPGDYASEELALGDVDGDGLADVVLGSYNSSGGRTAGAVYVVLGPASGTTDLASADYIIRGDAAGQYFGLGLTVADVDADGANELFVGAIGDSTAGSSAGAAFLFFGPMSGTLTPSDADAILFGEGGGDQAGEGLAVGDLDSDGELDLVIGAPAENTGGSAAGAVYVQFPVE